MIVYGAPHASTTRCSGEWALRIDMSGAKWKKPFDTMLPLAAKHIGDLPRPWAGVIYLPLNGDTMYSEYAYNSVPLPALAGSFWHLGPKEFVDGNCLVLAINQQGVMGRGQPKMVSPGATVSIGTRVNDYGPAFDP